MVDYSRDEKVFRSLNRVPQHEGDGSFRALNAEKVCELIMKISKTEQEGLEQMERLKRHLREEEHKAEDIR